MNNSDLMSALLNTDASLDMIIGAAMRVNRHKSLHGHPRSPELINAGLAVRSGFVWSDTPEGYTFWAYVSARLKDLGTEETPNE